MELGLSLGGIRDSSSSKPPKKSSAASKHLSFKDTRLSLNTKSTTQDDHDIDIDIDVHSSQKLINDKRMVPLHNLLTLAPLLHPCAHHSDDGSLEGGSPVNVPAASGLDMNKVGAAAAEEVSSAKRRSDQVIYRSGDVINKRSLASDDDYENGLTRKKLRLSKQQSAFLEQSFKQHNSLNTIQKHALAKQLNVRPRQVEVWFQNRRARTKLKQTEVDCEYLKKCSEALTEENRKLKKEIQELRALNKTSTIPHYNYKMQSPTLTMCSSCEATTSSFPLSRS